MLRLRPFLIIYNRIGRENTKYMPPKRQKVEEALWDFEVNGHVMEKLKYQIQISIAIRESVRN
jgi:hypothetical protein